MLNTPLACLQSKSSRQPAPIRWRYRHRAATARSSLLVMRLHGTTSSPTPVKSRWSTSPSTMTSRHRLMQRTATGRRAAMLRRPPMFFPLAKPSAVPRPGRLLFRATTTSARLPAFPALMMERHRKIRRETRSHRLSMMTRPTTSVSPCRALTSRRRPTASRPTRAQAHSSSKATRSTGSSSSRTTATSI